MTIGIVGLGLIGGSLAKAYKKTEDVTVLGWNRDSLVTDYALMAGGIDGVLNEDSIGTCDGILIALPPVAAVEYLRAMAPNIAKSALVIDCCGTKRVVCDACFPLAAQYGFTFVGGHPMAGTQYAGFKHSKAELFKGAPMVIVPPVFDDIALLDRVKKLLSPLGFGQISVTTAKRHDEMIAFTSQMAHVVSNAYIKSPTAAAHKGFSAGSYKDLTRVAWLNPSMWSELFLENSDCLLYELDLFIASLLQYRKALSESDGEVLTKLLDEGRRRKAEVDG